MIEQEDNQPVVGSEVRSYSVPWKSIDNWIGVGLLVLIEVVILGIALFAASSNLIQSVAVVLLEAAYLLPVAVIFAWRHVRWQELGFRSFDWKTLGLGCGLLVVSYSILMLYGILLAALKIETQGEQMMKVFAELDSPVWLFVAGTIAAPIVEEAFFRGFLFQGFRQRYGEVKAMLISSAIFAAGHLDPVSLLPIFVLGCVLAYVYHKSNSLWPGIILHFLNNAFALCLAYAAVYLQNSIPS